jgi:hypothetical protein
VYGRVSSERDGAERAREARERGRGVVVAAAAARTLALDDLADARGRDEAPVAL